MDKSSKMIKGFFSCILLAGALFSCTTEKGDRPVRPSDQVQLSFPGSSSERIKAVPAGETNFFVRLHARSAWKLTVLPEGTSWISLERSHGEATEHVRIAVMVKENLGASRSAKLIVTSEGVSDTLTIAQAGTGSPQPNPGPQPSQDPTGEYILGDVNLLEAPALAGGAHNYFITHRANGIVNYSLEYDTQKRHPRFVCFSFDDVTSQKKVKRSDAWAWDPQIPAKFSTENLFRGSGYDRGHMVASEDRVFSLEANQQTFYYSNMSPQLGGLNQKFWQQLEALVQSWGRNASLRDVIYVAKGGTIRDHEVEANKMRNMVVVPKHYWMALVVKKGATYHGLAFYVEHREYAASTRPSAVALSIDELEGKTGLDLFHNFPDDLEAKFEAETPTSPAFLSTWPGL